MLLVRPLDFIFFFYLSVSSYKSKLFKKKKKKKRINNDYNRITIFFADSFSNFSSKKSQYFLLQPKNLREMTADFAFLTTPKSNIFLRIFNHFIDVNLSFKRRLQLFETRSTGFECVFKCFYKKLLSFWTQLQLFLKKTMEQCLPLFVSFRPFLIPTLIIVSISTIQMKKHRYVFGVRRMVGVDKTTELQL